MDRWAGWRRAVIRTTARATFRRPAGLVANGCPERDGTVRFRILGPVEVWTGQAWAGIGAPKWRSLLAALLINAGQVVPTDRLIMELWGDAPPAGATNLVSIYALRLRR